MSFFIIVAVLFAVAFYASLPNNRLIEKVNLEQRSLARKCAIGLAIVLGLVLLHNWFWWTLLVAAVVGAVVLYRRKHQPIGRHKKSLLR